MSLQHLPDVNVWVAIHHRIHIHHRVALSWFNALDKRSLLVFCRQTQMGWFRLLTTEAILGSEALTQRECWKLYTKWLEAGSAELWSAPADLGDAFRRRTAKEERSPKGWNDAYLVAFAETAGLTLVTFDRALAGKAKDAILLS